MRQANISNRDIEALQLIKPSVAKQKRFTNIIESIEVQKQLTQRSLQKSEDLFQSLLQKAFKVELV